MRHRLGLIGGALGAIAIASSALAEELFIPPAALQQLPIQHRVTISPPTKAPGAAPAAALVPISVEAVHHLIDGLSSSAKATVANSDHPPVRPTRAAPQSDQACDALLDSPAASLGNALSIDAATVQR